MKIKEEVIREAYEKLDFEWNHVKQYVDENGCVYHKPGCLKCLTNNKNSVAFRPKTLSGIENNNGWIKIESEDDLPKETLRCWIKIGDDILCGSYNIDFNFFHYDGLNLKDHPVTHYQPIEKPNPPLY